MNSWAKKRKLVFFSIIIGFVFLWFFIFIAPNLKVVPTCADRIQNGNETGVDCGGSCSLFCSTQALDLSPVWTRPFKVIPGRYNVVALVENQNTEAAISSISYEFKLYDENNIFVTRRTGKTYILPNNQTAIFEAGLETGDRVVVRSEFSFTETPLWLQTPKFNKGSVSVSSSEIVMKDSFTNPRLTATIRNNGRFSLHNFDVVAILYNEDNNAIAVSATFIEELNETEEYNVFFTWQDPFREEPVRIEILPQVNVFGLNVYQ